MLLRIAKYTDRRCCGLAWSIVVLCFSWAASTPAVAQVVFQPKNCDFRSVFVVAPDVKEVVMSDENGTKRTSVIANLSVTLGGKANFFRVECTDVSLPPQLDQTLLLDDMKTIAQGNNIRNPVTWIEKSQSGDLVGRVRGQVADSTTTYVMDIRRYFGPHNIFDVWVGSPPGTFTSEGNLVFLKELRLNGKPIF